MRRVLFRIGRLNFYSYPTMLYVGIVLGIWAQLYAAGQVGLASASMLTATLVLLTTALLGARLLYVLPRWSTYRGQTRRIFRFSEGGASMYGGLLLAVPISALVLSLLRIPFGLFWDQASFTLLIGMIVTRVGCFLNGCCCGRPTRGWFGIELPDHNGVWTRRVPVQILEVAWGLLVLAGAVFLWNRLPFEGALLLYSVSSYAVGRIALEPARASQDRLLGMVLQRALSVAFIACSLLVSILAWWL